VPRRHRLEIAANEAWRGRLPVYVPIRVSIGATAKELAAFEDKVQAAQPANDLKHFHPPALKHATLRVERLV
jgi:hypothetical protein